MSVAIPASRRRARVWIAVVLGITASIPWPLIQPAMVHAAVPNEIMAENALAGTPASEWDIDGVGDASIQGFATDISVDQGQTVGFKVDSPSTDYRIDIYRLGWYGGDGARKVTTIQPSATLPQAQPDCLIVDGTTDDNLVDCGTWGVSASWAVPATAVSGIYLARPVREDVGGDVASHIVFVVRDDDGQSDVLFQTSDTTWQAYNQYGGYSLYGGPSGHAHKVSYNRPFTTRGYAPEDWVFNAEFPMLRWLERNGYDVSYSTDVDTDRRGGELLEHELFLSVGHDEYWSAGQRANVEAARDAGLDLAFFSGNEVYWKTRWESSVDGAAVPYRTLVAFKEGDAAPSGAGEHWDCAGVVVGCDPDPAVWTGLWRQNQAGHDGGRPENALSGQISWINNTTAIEVPAAFKTNRLWRNTDIATMTTPVATLEDATLGYEWDGYRAEYASSYPAGQIHLSETSAAGAVHRMSLYRQPGGGVVFGAGTVQWMWGLDGIHDRGPSAEDPRMQQATVNLLSDMGAQPGTLQAGLQPGAALDGTSPTATIMDPAPGATVPGGSVTVTGEAADVGGIVAAVEVSRDAGATWQRATGTNAWTYTFSATDTAVTVLARAIDDAANQGTPDSVTFTVGGQSCPCSLWDASVTPPIDDEVNTLELGVKFHSDSDGFITGIRYYKSAANTGTHVGSLWTLGGTTLGQVTFTGESSTGWQQASFDAPIAITAGTTYVASYHTNTGRYGATNGYFATARDNAPLHAPADGGPAGGNGVYAVSNVPTFPNQTFQSSNYWVDVVFETTVGPDTTPPTVVQRSPTPGASGVAVGATVTARFNEAMTAGSIGPTTFELRDPSSNLVSALITYDAGSRTATLDPGGPLDHSITYTATVKGGSGGVADASGNELAGDVSWSFSTAAPPPPPPDEGPGGPILVVSAAANPFSRFYVEILRNEGLNAFTASDLSSVTAGVLATYKVVILGEVGVTSAQATMFADWVGGGGNLIAMRPDPDLWALLGLADTGTDLSDAYLQIDTTAGKPGAGLVGATIQFHSTADRYTLTGGAESLATLFSTATVATSNPAVTMRSVGSNGGQAVAFTYDLARSVVYTRQGNPAWAGQERDGQQPPIKRSDDMFFPDWIDFDKVQIPQADEQQRLLANVIEHVSRDTLPLPRFWYFPRGEKAVVVMTGDDHSSGGTDDQFAWFAGRTAANCSVADWDCIRATSYVYPGTLSDSVAAALEAQGFEISIHVNTGCGDWTPTALDGFYDDQLATFAAATPSVPAPSTHRTHCIAWSDWATQAMVELDHGIRLDTNYYYWPESWMQNRPGMFTGSGMPMRFADLDGTLIDVYQAATQITDETNLNYQQHIETLLDNALGAPGYYGAFTMNMHTDGVSHAGAQTIVAEAQAQGVPVVSARQLLTWLDGRNGSSFGNLSRNGAEVSFSIAVGAGANGLQAMLPTTGVTGTLQSLARNGGAVAFTLQTIKGIQYATFPATAGDFVATYGVDATGPAISAILATPHGDGTASVTWTTDEPSDSRVDYGTSAGSLTLSATDAAETTSHSVLLTGLAPTTTYHFRVTSEDATGNASTSPASPAAPATFSTPTASLTDTTADDFTAGTTGSATYVAQTANGEVILGPTVGAEFSGTSLPGGWVPNPWSGGGSVTVGGGSVTLDQAATWTTGFHTPGRSVEFVTNFSAQNQHVGFANDFNAGHWAIFSSGANGDQLYARSNVPGGVDTGLGASYLNSSHRFRIEWTATSATYFIDGNQVAQHTGVSFTDSLRPAASDFNPSGSLAVDWMRMTPVASTGTFVSRVLDAGTSSSWGTFSVASSTPPGTSISYSVRQGNTPVPDGTWSAFGAITAGGTVAGNARYIQYRAVLGTSDPGVTPALESVSIGYTTAQDTDPPAVSSRAPGAGATGIAVGTNVTVTFDEAMSASTFTTTTFRLRADGAGADVPAAVSYNGATATLDPTADLAAGTLYHATVAGTVTDAAGNPLGSDETWSFTTAAPITSATDTTVADFGAGITTGTHVANAAGGEVILAPTVVAEFDGGALPTGWESGLWNPGGAATVGSASLSVDGAWARTTATFGSGRAVEFVATFSGATFQNAGFGQTLESGGESWAMFGMDGTANTLRVRLNLAGAASQPVDLGSIYLGTPHRYRIEWGATQIRFLVDGQDVHTANAAIGAPMRPIASDFATGGGSLAIDWMRLSPYAGSGTFTSRVIDAGQTVAWGLLDATTVTPPSTAIGFEVRGGNVAVPDGSWTGFVGVANGSDIPHTSRYLQYRATLATTDASRTPVLESVTLAWAPGSDGIAPTIVGRSPAPGASGVDATTDVTITFSEPIDPSSVTSSSVRLRAQGVGADVPATLGVAGSTVTLDPTTDLASGVTYTATVTTGIRDLGGNALGGDVSWTFTTSAAPVAFTDTTVADFDAGTHAGTSTSATSDGEVILSPTAGSEFQGTSLPSGWSSTPWTGGTSAVNGGLLVVDGALAQTDVAFTSGRSLEFGGTFGAATFQHIGFSDGPGFATFAMFSTAGSTNTVFARTSASSNFAIPLSLIGSSHRYRIDWTATQVVFSVDGNVVHIENVTIGASMRPMVSDFTNGGPVASVDWMRLSPYATPGQFTSRVHDAGVLSHWTTLERTMDLPAGTAIAFETRTGPVATPDGTWSSWAPVTGTAIASPAGRYVQYRATLTTTDPSTTPELRSVVLSAIAAPANQAPTAVDDTFTTPEDTALVLPTSGIGSPADNDTDPEDDTLTVSAVAETAVAGSVALVGTEITFTPGADLCGVGAGSFGYTVSDGNGGTAPGTVTVDLTCVNDEPVFDQDILDQSGAEGDLVSLDAGASDIDGPALVFEAVGLPGGLSIHPATGVISGSIAFDASAASPHSVTVTVRDGTTVDDTDTFTWTVADTAGVGLVLATSEADPTNASAIPVTATFTEPVVGFTAGDITVANGTVEDFAGSGDEYTFLVAPTADGQVTIDIAAGVAASAAGNPNTASTTLSLTSDRSAPTVTVTSTASEPTNASPIPVTVTFSEPVIGFIGTDVTIGNGSLTGIVGDGTTYELQVTPAGDGLVTVTVATGVAADAAGNASTASNTLTRTSARTGPTVTVEQAVGQADPTGTSPIRFSVTFSVPVADFGATDVTLGGTATGGSATVTGSGTTYEVAVSDMTAGSVTASLGAGVAHDTVGNPNSESTSADNAVTYDPSRPSVVLSAPATSPTNAATIPVTITFSEPVTGFTQSDISAGNGSLGDFAGSGANYSATVTPTADGPVTVDVAELVAVDSLGNGNTAAVTLTRVSDRTAPALTLTAPANGTSIDDTTPALSGIAGTASGDAATVTVRVYAGTSATGTPLQTRTATRDPSTGAYTVDATTLAFGTYTARASQPDGAGNTGLSSPSTFTITDLTPPASPASLAVAPLSTGLRLTWTANTEPDLSGYDVYRASAAGGPFTMLNPTRVTTTSYLDTTATPGAIAYYRVIAVDTFGNPSAPASTDRKRPTIAFRSVATGQNGTAANLTIARPAGASTDDVLVAVVTVRGSQTITAPGWTLVRTEVSGTALRQSTYVRVVSGATPTTFTWTFSSSVAASGGIAAYRGVDIAQPVDAHGGQVTASGSSITAPSITTTVDDALLIGVFGMASNPTMTPEAGMLEQFEILATGKNKVATQFTDQIRASAGGTGTRITTADKSAVSIGQSLALRPADAPPPPVDSTPPTRPTNVQATAVSQTRIDLTWTASTDLVGVHHYEIFRNGSSTALASPTGTSYSDTTVVASTTYTYVVKALDAAGNVSDPSDPPASATTPDPPPVDSTPPTRPTNVQATAVSQTRIDLTWTASTDLVGVHHYEIFRNGSSTALASPTGTSYSDTTVVASTTYTYVVKALDAAGNVSDPSDPPASATTPATPPTAPTFRGVTTGSAKSATTLVMARPAGVVANDVMLASIDLLSTATITAPSGWTLVRRDVAGSTMSKATYLKVAGSSEPSTFTWTFAGSQVASGVLVAYSGVNTANPIDVSGGQANGSSGTVTAPAVLQTVPNARLVGFFGIATNATFTPPTGMTERADLTSASGNNKVSSEVADEVHPVPGDTHVHAASASKGAVNIGHIVVLRPVGT